MTLEKAKKIIKSECYIADLLDLDRTQTVNIALDTVIEAAEQKPQKAKGHWSDECECSVCGNQPWYEGSTFRKNYKFCPYCGADMRGSDTE